MRELSWFAFAEGAETVFLAGLVVYVSTNLDNLLLLTAMMAGVPNGWRLGGAAMLATGGVLVVAGLALGSVAAALPQEHIGWLGLIPLSLGLRAAWQTFRGDSARTTLVTGIFPVIGILLANSSDTLAVLAPAIAETGRDYALPLLLGFIAGPLIMAALLRPLLASRALRRLLARLGPYLAPAIMILVGLYILSDSPTDSF